MVLHLDAAIDKVEDLSRDVEIRQNGEENRLINRSR
jgi:hypothetical protein